MNKVLSLNDIEKMTVEQLLQAFEQGYRVVDIGDYDVKALVATCPTKVTKGTTKNITLQVTSPGTPPYTFKITRNDQPLYSVVGGANETSKLIPHTFNEEEGTYTYKGFVTDSCSAGAKTSNVESCNIEVTTAPVMEAGIPWILVLGLGVGAVYMITRKK